MITRNKTAPLGIPKLETKSSGQSLVELTLVLPILILILAGTLDLGRLLESYVTLTNAAREGARLGAETPTNPTGIKNQVIAEANGSGYTITTSMITILTPSGTTSGNPITVRINYNFQFVTFLMFAGAQTFPVQTSATMMIW